MTSSTPDNPVRRLVVKVGTSTLTDVRGGIDAAYIAELAAQLAAQRAAGRDVVLVTSGAIRAGRAALEGETRRHGDKETTRRGTGSANPQSAIRNPQSSSSLIPHPSSLPYKQAAAAIGQGLLMRTYTEAFAAHGATVAQVLLTRDDLAERGRFLNARNTLSALLSLGVVPIINENDTVAVEEIRFGDNDQLAAHVAVLAEADLLLILSDVEGLYAPAVAGSPTHPHTHTPTPLRLVPRVTPEIEALAGDVASGVGTGGMRTKLAAARIAIAAGVRTVIACGRRPAVVAEVVCDGGAGQVGTTFAPAGGRLRGRKRWIAAGSRVRGAVVVNARAADKLRREGVSLLAVGITEVAGVFGPGDLIEVRDETGRRFARGLTNYGADDLRRIRGLRTDQFEAALGAKTYDEVIHRDNMVVEG